MRMTLEKTGEGARYFLQGLAKKVLIGDTIYRLYGTLRALPMASVTMAAAWTMVVTLAFSVYFILAGFCDMARGLALIFGFELQDNFHAPFGSIGINDFFHASISQSTVMCAAMFISILAARRAA